MDTPEEMADKAEKELRENPNISKETLQLIANLRKWSKDFTEIVETFIKECNDDN